MARSLTQKQRVAIQLIGGQGYTNTRAAQDSGVNVSRRTIQSWLKRDDFRREVAKARSLRLQDSPDAHAVLISLLQATDSRGNADNRTRLGAARCLLGFDRGGKPPTAPTAQAITFTDEMLDDDDDLPLAFRNVNNGK